MTLGGFTPKRRLETNGIFKNFMDICPEFKEDSVMSSMLIERIEIMSEKHGIKGEILDYGMVIKLRFSHNGKEIEMGMSRPLEREKLIRQAIGCMDTYIDQLSSSEERPTKLFDWHVDLSEREEGPVLHAHGTVTGHPRLPDSMFVNTTRILHFVIDHEKGEAILQTRNTLYHCPLSYLHFSEQDQWPDALPEYELLKEKYKDKKTGPTIEPGKVLLVICNFTEYYFHSLYYQPEGTDAPLEASGYPHIGTFQDSFLIGTKNHEIDLRYFPHYQNIEFYSEDTDDKPWYIENIGDVTLFAKTSKGLIKLLPGERKEVCSKNAVAEKPVLATGDLYPAGIIE